MFGFGKYPVSEDLQHWVYEEFCWAAKNGLFGKDSPLVTPTKEYFPMQAGGAENVARGAVLQILGRSEEEITLVPHRRPSVEIRAAASFEVLSEATGAWDRDAGDSVIFFAPEGVGRPLVFIATLIHEVMHHVLHGLPDVEQDAGSEELSTDLHMISGGFGLLSIAGAGQAGWFGYMTQSTRIHALALFLHLRKLSADLCKPWLSSRRFRDLRRACQQIGKSEIDRSHFAGFGSKLDLHPRQG